MIEKHTPGRLYADRDIFNQGPHYVAHVRAMTAEGLHSKSDIAAELAHRDIVICELLAALTHIEGVAMAGEWRDLPEIAKAARTAIEGQA